jgi:glycosyltransferase involved in cell wall biosynthesis
MTKRAPPVFSICIPSYNSAAIIGETLDSVFAQTFGDFEVVIVDDASTDGTDAFVRSLGDERVRLERNPVNLGYAANIARCTALARGTYVYLLGNDDLLSPVALERTLAAFESDPDVALVTRPYFWFASDDPTDAIRHLPPPDPERDLVVSIDADDTTYRAVIDSLGQLSGLAFRRQAIADGFDEAIFTAHVRPFLATWKQHKAVFLKDYVVAVRVVSSQTRSLSSIYDPSPVLTWVQLFDSVFSDRRFQRQRRVGRRHLAGHVQGLVQVRCYAPFRVFAREVGVLVRYRPQNLLRAEFWGTTLGLSLLPRSWIIGLVDRLKPVLTRTRERGIALARPAGAGAR